MRAIDSGQLKEGMRVARAIYDDAGRVLLNEGVVLNSRYIKRLNKLGLPFIYVEDELLGPIEVEDVINDQLKIQTAKALKNTVKSARVHKDLDLRPISDMVNKILDELKGAPDILVQLMDLRNVNTYFYDHSVGVSVLSILTGRNLGLDDLKLKVLGMGAILHDIGKSLSLGPEHTEYGFEILRKNKSINIMVAHVAYQHHERYDGTGYPRKLSGKEIHFYAAIVGLANYYDSLVTNIDVQERLYPYQALESIVAQSEQAFHPEIVKAFCRNIAPYPVGTSVRLNNGAVGVVIAVPKDYTTRPVIKLITDEIGTVLEDFPEISLLEEKTLVINEIITEKERQKITRHL